MENIQVLNDGADEKDLKELLEILKGFGQVEVLYDLSDPKDKDVTADEVIERYDNFKKKVKMDANTSEILLVLVIHLDSQQIKRIYLYMKQNVMIQTLNKTILLPTIRKIPIK